MSKRQLWPLICFSALLIVPVWLIYLGVIPFEYRFWTLILVTIISAILVPATRITLSDLGIRSVQWKKSVLPYLLTTLPLLALLALAPSLGLAGRKWIPESLTFYIFYIVILSPCQEFLFRSLIRGSIVRAGRSGLEYVALSSVLYSFLHLIYRDVFTLVITLAIGLVWSAIYWRRPNLLFVSISHAVLGLVTIRLGLI